MFPDLNPIEHLWDVLKLKAERQNPSSKEQMKRIICEEHLYTDLSGIIHDSEDQICHLKYEI